MAPGSGDFLGFGWLKDYIVDSMAGMAWASPVLGLAAVPVWVGIRKSRAPRTALASSGISRRAEAEPPSDGFGSLTAALLVSCVAGVVPSLMVAASTMRYLADATPSLTLLSSLGIWVQLQSAPPRFQARLVTSVVLLTAYSALMGMLLGVAGHYGRFITDTFGGGR